MGPFNSKAKAKKIVHFLKINNEFIDRMGYKEKKLWIKNFTDLIKFLIL